MHSLYYAIHLIFLSLTCGWAMFLPFGMILVWRSAAAYKMCLTAIKKILILAQRAFPMILIALHAQGLTLMYLKLVIYISMKIRIIHLRLYCVAVLLLSTETLRAQGRAQINCLTFEQLSDSLQSKPKKVLIS